MMRSTSIATRPGIDCSQANLFPVWGNSLIQFLIVAYCFLVPLVVLPLGANRYGICEPLLCLIPLAAFLTQTLYRPHPFHIAMALFLGIALFSLLMIDDTSQLFSSSMRWVRLIAVTCPLFLGLTFEVTPRAIRLAFRSFFWGGLLAIVIGLIVYWLQIPLNVKSQMLWIEGQDPTIRASGLIGDTGAFGHLVATWALASLGGFLLFPGRAWRLGFAFVLSIAMYAIITSSSRGALLNLGVGCFVLWLLYPSDRRQKLNVVLTVIGITSFLATVFVICAALEIELPGSHQNKVFERFFAVGHGSVNSFTSNRLDGWNTYLSEFSDQFIFGTGYKTSDVILPGRTTDNVLLCAVVETGILGLTAICVFAGSLFIELFTRIRQHDRFAVVVCSLWCGQVLHGMTADTYTLWLAMPALYLITGLVMCSHPQETQP